MGIFSSPRPGSLSDGVWVSSDGVPRPRIRWLLFGLIVGAIWATGAVLAALDGDRTAAIISGVAAVLWVLGGIRRYRERSFKPASKSSDSSPKRSLPTANCDPVACESSRGLPEPPPAR